MEDPTLDCDLDCEVFDHEAPNPDLFDTEEDDILALWAEVRGVCKRHCDVLALRSFLSEGDVTLETLHAHRIEAGAYNSDEINKHFRKNLVSDFDHLDVLSRVSIKPRQVRDYLKALKHYNNNEELAAAIEAFIARGVPNHGTQRHDSQHKAYKGWKLSRHLDYIREYNEDLWCQPPAWHQVEPNSFRPPKAAYWIAVQSPELVQLLEPSCFVATTDDGTKITSPYLSIDYLEGEENKPATACLLYTSTFVLYNRFVLREKAFHAEEDSEADMEVSDIRHYSLAFNKTTFQLWCLKPKAADNAGSVSYPSRSDASDPIPWWAYKPKKGDTSDSPNKNNEYKQTGKETLVSESWATTSPTFSLTSASTVVSDESEDIKPESRAQIHNPAWRGCFASLLLEGNSSLESDLNKLAAWLNAIHRWGLADHAPATEKDCRTISETSTKSETSKKLGKPKSVQRAESENWW